MILSIILYTLAAIGILALAFIGFIIYLYKTNDVVTKNCEDKKYILFTNKTEVPSTLNFNSFDALHSFILCNEEYRDSKFLEINKKIF